MSDSATLTVHADRAEGLVRSGTDSPPDTYVMIEIDGNKRSRKKSKVVEDSANPVWDQDLKIDSSQPNEDVLIILVMAKDVGRDEQICDKVKIPFKEFLPVGKQEERVIDLKFKKRDAGKLYLSFHTTPQ